MNEWYDLLEELVRCKPVSADVEAVNLVQKKLFDFLRAKGVFCTLEKNVSGGRDVLFAGTSPDKTPDYLFNAHLDVVPAPDRLFQMRRSGDGRAFGRGVKDCLGPAVAIARSLTLMDKNVSAGAFFSADEEIGGATAAAMIKRGYGARKMAAVVDAAAYAIIYAEKGILNLRLVAHGQSGHSSCPWAYENALDKLIDGYTRLRAAWPPVPADHWGDTMCATLCTAGTAANAVPEHAEMTLNIRYITPGGADEIIERVRSVSGLDVEVKGQCSPVVLPPDAPILQKLLAFMKKKFGREDIPLYRMDAATDARHMVALNVPVVVLGVEGGLAHSDDEWLNLDSLLAYSEMIAGFCAE